FGFSDDTSMRSFASLTSIQASSSQRITRRFEPEAVFVTGSGGFSIFTGALTGGLTTGAALATLTTASVRGGSSGVFGWSFGTAGIACGAGLAAATARFSGARFVAICVAAL